MHLNEADFNAIEAEACKRSLATFVKQAWHILEPGAPLGWGWALDAMCEHLEAVTDGRIKRLLMNVPPGMMKSLLTGVFWPAWEWGPKNMPEMRFVGTAHEEQLAIRDSRKCRQLIKSDWYQSKWKIDLSSDLDGKREFGNTSNGVRQARSFTSMTGVRGDRVVLDDPISAFDANSAAKLEAARVAFTETLPTRVNNSDSAIVVIMQRLNEADTSGVILDNDLGYTHLCIPMRYETNRKCKTSIGWEDPRTEEGELAFPERFSEEQVAELEKTLGPYGTAGQLQQRPAPRGGGIIKTSCFDYYEDVLPPLDFRFITVDTAQKKGEQNDYSVAQCWARSKIGQAVMIDSIRGKWEINELITRLRAFTQKQMADDRTNSVFRGLWVEDKVSGTSVIQMLRSEGYPVMAVQRNRDKVSRGHDVVPFVASGNVLLPMDAPWLSDFLHEVGVFPSGAHDDQVDPFIDAVDIVKSKKFVEKTSRRVSTTVPTIAHRW